MFKLVISTDQRVVAITNYSGSEPETALYVNADAKFFYNEQIIEIHTQDKFVSILPLGLTYVIFE